jgi:hypothetical protein
MNLLGRSEHGGYAKHGERQNDRPTAVNDHCFILIPFSVL